MKYFTADLVNKWNVLDMTGQNDTRENDEWDNICETYEAYAAELYDRMPLSVRKFGEVVLHEEAVLSMPLKPLEDGKLAGYQPGDTYTVVTTLEAEDLLHAITYTLEEAPRVIFHEGNGFDPVENVAVWLYDEFGIDEHGKFTHHVLFSNGVELCIVFRDMHWRECSVTTGG